MSQQSHLRSVTPPADGGGANGGGAEASKSRAPQVQRATLPLPTERLVSDLQFRILQTIARLSGGRKAMITAADIGKATGDVAASSVVLSNRFYVAIGYIEKDSEGRYAASDALVEYSRRLATHDTEYALQALHGPAQRAWFWVTLAPRLAEGPVKMGDAKILLMREAEAGDSHVGKVTHLITWLRMIGLIAVNGDEITLAERADTDMGDAPRHSESEPENNPGETGSRNPPSPGAGVQQGAGG